MRNAAKGGFLMARKSFVFVVLAVTIAVAGKAHAMTLSSGDTNIVELLQQSNDIVVGKVEAITDGIDDKGIPYTEVTLNVSEAIRGGLSNPYKFRQFGLLKPRLTADGKRKMMPAPPGFPKYTQGEQLVLMMRPAAAWTGFRMPAGVTLGKFNVTAGRVENDANNAGLFRNVKLDQGLVQEQDKRLLTTASGAVNPDAFLNFVRRAVNERWIESGRMARADGRALGKLPPPSAAASVQSQPAPAIPAADPDPQTVLLDPNTRVALPGPRR
jgi:hypothetical protein